MANVFDFLRRQQPEPQAIDAPEEHRIQLAGVDIAISHSLKTVFMVDLTGGTNVDALHDLEDFFRSQGYFLHCVVVKPDAKNIHQTPPNKNE